MANLRTNNLSGEGGRNAIKGSVVFGSDVRPAGLRIEDNSELELGSETHWTIEFWLFLNGSTHGDYDVVLGKGSGTGNNYEYYVEIMADNTLDFLTTTAGTAWDFQQQISPVLQHDSWHHIAIVRNGSGSNSLKSYVNGQEYGSFTAQNIHTSSYPFGIGYYAGYHAGNGLFADVTVSNLRICKGHAVYTANFTPPFYELKSHYIDGDDKTVLLCCQDSDNPFQEATGKTITGKGRYEYLNDEEVVLNGTFDTDTSSWTTQGDTVEIDNQRLKIIRSGSFGSATQQLNARMTTNTQYKFRGRIEQTGSPGSALLRLSSASNGNGTVFFNGAYGTGVHETIFTYSSGGGFYVSAIAGNGNVTGIWDDISVKAINPGTPPKNIPPYGVDAGNRFGGAISMNSSAWMYLPTGRTEERGRGRGLIVANYIAPANTNACESITIQSMGNSVNFGDAAAAVRGNAVFASSTRAVSGSGYVAPANVNTIEFFTIATQSNSTNFGDLNGSSGNYTPISNETRGIFAGGYAYPALFNNIDYVTIATTGNSTDFGGLTTLRADSNRTAVNSTTRGLIGAGYVNPTGTNIIESLTIATTGNSQDFGDLTAVRSNLSGFCSSTRGIFAGGSNSTNNIMDFVTIASAGDAIDFGDLICNTTLQASSATSNNIRGVIAGGDNQPANTFTNTMQHVTIATTGDAQDFGDMLTVGAYRGMTSDSHGGLS